MPAQAITTATRPDLEEQSRAALLADWPAFILADRTAAGGLIARAGEYFPEFDIRLLADGEVVAGGWGVPLRWDGVPASLPAGYDGALTEALAGRQAGLAGDTLCVMAAAVRPDRRATGLAGQVISELRDRARQAGLGKVVVPVRPPLKASYPLTPMATFATWARPDGLHLDGWIRTHQRLGATIVGPARRSMIVTGTIADWQRWTAMAFPSTGRYVVPGGHDLVYVNLDRDHGEYHETNLWMRHA